MGPPWVERRGARGLSRTRKKHRRAAGLGPHFVGVREESRTVTRLRAGSRAAAPKYHGVGFVAPWARWMPGLRHHASSGTGTSVPWDFTPYECSAHETDRTARDARLLRRGEAFGRAAPR